MGRDRHNQRAVPVGCQSKVHAILIDGRYFRWRCTDVRCPAVQEAREHGAWAFHVFDLLTGEISDEEEPARRAA